MSGPLTEVEVELFYINDNKPTNSPKNETEMLVWLKEKANAEYEAKGFVIVGFTVLSVGVDPTSRVENFTTLFKRHSNKPVESISALVKVSALLPGRAAPLIAISRSFN
jgi:hypothetical protein